MHTRRFLPLAPLLTTMATAALAAAEPGRLLYTVDDDWDWASPLGAEEPSDLSRYGAMPWSALDWAEEGLAEVRGVMIGSPPDDEGYMTGPKLSALRGAKANYSKQIYKADSIAPLLGEAEPPNLIILVQDKGRAGKPSPDDVDALVGFVKDGGRLVVLDDWRHCDALMESLLAEVLESADEPHGAKPHPPEDVAAQLPDAELVAKVERLLAKLSDDNFLVREAAAAELIKLGEAILPLIAAPEGVEAEVRARLAQIRAEIDPDLKPVVPVPGVGPREARHQERARHMTDTAAKLEAAGVPHRLDDVFVNKNGDPLPALRMTFTPR